MSVCHHCLTKELAEANLFCKGPLSDGIRFCMPAEPKTQTRKAPAAPSPGVFDDFNRITFRPSDRVRGLLQKERDRRRKAGELISHGFATGLINATLEKGLSR